MLLKDRNSLFGHLILYANRPMRLLSPSTRPAAIRVTRRGEVKQCKTRASENLQGGKATTISTLATTVVVRGLERSGRRTDAGVVFSHLEAIPSRLRSVDRRYNQPPEQGPRTAASSPHTLVFSMPGARAVKTQCSVAVSCALSCFW
jgi:hypothetical protein